MALQRDCRKKIAVVARGRIGLPLAVQFVSTCYKAMGVNVNRSVVDLVNDAAPYGGRHAVKTVGKELLRKQPWLVPACSSSPSRTFRQLPEGSSG